MTQEQLLRAAARDEAALASVESATPVPDTFEESIALACKATMKAAEAGYYRQSVYFDAGEGDGDIGGNLGRVLPFAEAFAKAMAAIKEVEGGKVRVLFSDMGGKSICENRWAPLPPGLVLDYFPPVARNQGAGEERIRIKLEESLDADVIIVVAISQAEVQGFLNFLDLLKKKRGKVPVILLNCKLVEDASLAAGAQLKEIVSFVNSTLPTFHLEQVEPPDEAELNAAVVCRVWPKPFSVWEDNPDDPEAVDGFFLLDVSNTDPPSPKEIKNLLKTSQEIADAPALPQAKV